MGPTPQMARRFAAPVAATSSPISRSSSEASASDRGEPANGAEGEPRTDGIGRLARADEPTRGAQRNGGAERAGLEAVARCQGDQW